MRDGSEALARKAAAFRALVTRTMSPCDTCDAWPRSFCAGLPDREAAALEEIVTALRFSPGDVIVTQDEPATVFFNVTKGYVKVYRTSGERAQVRGFLTAGDFLGLPVNGRFGFTAEALSDVEVCHFDRRRFEALMEKHPQLEQRFMRLASNELAAAQEQMMILRHKASRARLAGLLVSLARRDSCGHKTVHRLSLPMSRADIANFIGVSPETVSRAFASLTTAGLIALDDPGYCRLRDLAGLERLADLD